jgi:hypothetical protein
VAQKKSDKWLWGTGCFNWFILKWSQKCLYELCIFSNQTVYVLISFRNFHLNTGVWVHIVPRYQNKNYKYIVMWVVIIQAFAVLFPADVEYDNIYNCWLVHFHAKLDYWFAHKICMSCALHYYCYLGKKKTKSLLDGDIILERSQIILCYSLTFIFIC